MRPARKLLALSIVGFAAAAFCAGAVAEDVVKPDLGAGPHRDGSGNLGGAGKPRKGAEPPQAVQPAGASTGSSAATPEDANAQQIREEDERRATESKKKMKKKPGYKEDVPAPRASSHSSTAN